MSDSIISISRSSRSRPGGVAPASSLVLAPASSMTSMALSGRNLPLMNLSARLAQA
ncbi:MAG: hypothetical protein BWX47_01304 [candidate division Hyd24-12 bacterium ADurb.Bin004]|nr:MAG: hypothetical protein BWX47_01304 [candidate division Hyd24-12 bacterium ADurb.Bin004]